MDSASKPGRPSGRLVSMAGSRPQSETGVQITLTELGILASIMLEERQPGRVGAPAAKLARTT
jgi:hypothetical protein